MTRGPTPRPSLPVHYGDLRAQATMWWALQRARIRLTQAAGAADRAGWGTPEDPLHVGLKAVAKQERVAARATVKACRVVYPVVAQLVDETVGLGTAVALYLGLVPPLHRLEDFPGFPNPSALWAYSGLSAERRDKCDRRARMIAIAYIGTPAIIQSPEFHALYAARRATTAARNWTKMHAHRDATRYVAKRILKYLWLCRLPVGSPQESLAPAKQITAAGAAPAVASPTDSLDARDKRHDGAAPAAPESDVLPNVRLLPHMRVSAPESDAPPHTTLSSAKGVSAPEPDAQPHLPLPSAVRFSTPEPVSRPLNRMLPTPELTAPESVVLPKLALLPDQLVTTPDAP